MQAGQTQRAELRATLGLSCSILITENMLSQFRATEQQPPRSTCKRHVGVKGGNRSSTRLQWGHRPAPGEGESQGVRAGGIGGGLSLQRGPKEVSVVHPREWLIGGASSPMGAGLPETPAALRHPRPLFPRRSLERRSNGAHCRPHYRGGTRGPSRRSPHPPLPS